MTLPTRILFIGNSYTFQNDLPRALERLVASDGKSPSLETKFVGAGGWTFERHWEEALDRRAAVAAGGWDYVVLQEQTRRPYEDTPKFKAYASRFDALAKDHGAKTVLYLTWAPGFELDKQGALNSAYGSLGRELNVPVVPAGPAFDRVNASERKVRLYGGDGRHPSPVGTYLAACCFYAWLREASPAGRPHEVFDGAEREWDLDAKLAAFLQETAWVTC
ncbi:MAG: hypothetical protein M5U26_25005 [Planctomycetota bacterium]|nr:hypothetical protein [Planctomycetota bacterium]